MLLTGLDFCVFLCAARLTGPESIIEPGNRWANSALKAADTASLGGVRGGVMKRGVVLGVGGMTSEGWIKKPGTEEELEGTELWIGPTPEAAAAAAEVVWCSLASSLAFCFQDRQRLLTNPKIPNFAFVYSQNLHKNAGSLMFIANAF